MRLSQLTELISTIRKGATSPQNLSDAFGAIVSNPPYTLGDIATPGVNLTFVRDKNDLPLASNGVITLPPNVAYYFVTTVDLEGDRLVCGENTTLLGSSSENCRIKSTGLTDPLITSVYSLPMRGLTIEATHALDLSGDGTTTALDWFGVNFTDCATVGTVEDYSNFIMTDCAFLNSSGLTLDGTIGTVGFSSCLFDSNTGGTVITIPATAEITRRFRIIYSSFVVGSGETGINLSGSATIPTEGYILDTVNFSGGGTYTTGVAYTDDKARFTECRGIANSAVVGYYTMTDNATATVIESTEVPVKVAGTTTSQAVTQRFSHSNNRLTYTGALTRVARVSVILGFTTGANDRVGIYIARNNSVISFSESYATANAAGRVETVSAQTLVSLGTNDYIEVFVQNESDTDDITVTELSVIIEAQL